MKRIVSLLAAVSLVSSSACVGAEAWEPGTGLAPQAQQQQQQLETYSDTTTEACAKIPPAPTVPEALDLDRWDFTNVPLLPTTTATRSLYYVTFESPVDRTRVYVYGMDLAANRFIFAGSLNKRFVPMFAQRAGIDISHFQTSGASNPKSGGLLEIEGPIPPPPPPNIHDWSVGNYGKYAWQKAAFMHGATF
jgi:hypothetical protein